MRFGDVVGGDGLPVNYYTNLIGKTERHTFHAHFDYDITNSINFSIDGEYGKVKTDNTSGAWPSRFISISADNAYLVGHPDLITAQAAGQAANPPFLPFAWFNKDWSSQLNSHSTFDTTVCSVVGDLSGGIGDTSWTWDAYVTHGHTKRVQTVHDNPHLNVPQLCPGRGDRSGHRRSDLSRDPVWARRTRWRKAACRSIRSVQQRLRKPSTIMASAISRRTSSSIRRWLR